MEILQRKCQKMISAKKQGDPLMLHAVLRKLEVSQTSHIVMSIYQFEEKNMED